MELEMGTETRQRILDEIRESVRRPPGPDEVTTRMVAQADPDLDQDSARKILKQKVKDGIMFERDGVMRNVGGNCKVYGYKDKNGE